MAVVLLQSLVFLLQPPKPALVVPLAPTSHGRLRCGGGLTAPYYSHRWPGHPSTHPHPLLFCSDGSLTLVLLFAWASTAASSPAPRCPLPRPRRRPPPWSMWSTTDFHRKSTVRGEADSWVHGRSKEVPPYYAQINIPPPDSGDPPDGPLYFVKKHFPLTAGTHQLHLRM